MSWLVQYVSGRSLSVAVLYKHSHSDYIPDVLVPARAACVLIRQPD